MIAAGAFSIRASISAASCLQDNDAPLKGKSTMWRLVTLKSRVDDESWL